MTVFDELLEAGAAVAAISGVSDGDCGWDDAASGARADFLRRAGAPPQALVALRQCHGDAIVAADRKHAGSGAHGRDSAMADADGLMTAEPRLPLGIMVADCVPVFLAAPGAVALVHAGREGTFRGIARKAAQQLCVAYGIAPSSLFALIGPSAGPCCYEVSPELRDAWTVAGMVAHGRYLDLWASNQRQLRDFGVPAPRIRVHGHCTICQPGYHSYRGHGTAKRNLAVIMR